MRGLARVRAALERRGVENALFLFFATLLVVDVNVLAERLAFRVAWSERVDSEVTPETARFLAALPDDFRATGLLADSDEEGPALRAFLEQLRLRGVAVDTVDPDRQRTKYLGLRLDELGEASARAALLLERGDARAIVTLPGPDARRAWSTFRFLERGLVERASALLDDAPKIACFLVGDGERAPSDTSLRGLSELRNALERQRIDAVEVDLRELPSDHKCDSWAIVGPSVPLPEATVELLESQHREGAALAFWLDPLTDRRSEVRSSGVEPLAERAGVRIGAGVVIEGDRERRLVDGEGERFVATMRPHGVTENVAPNLADARLTVAFSRPIELTAQSTASLLLTSSERASVLSRLDGRIEPRPADRPIGLGVLGDRAAFFGTSTLVENESLRASEHALRFAEALFGHLHGRRSVAAIPLHPSAPPRELLESEARFLTTFALVAWPGLLGLSGVAFFVLRRSRPPRKEPA